MNIPKNMPTAQEIFEDLKQRDSELVSKVIAAGMAKVSDEILQLSRDMAKHYDTLWTAELFGDAERLRAWAYFWAERYQQATGKEEHPQIPRYRTAA